MMARSRITSVTLAIVEWALECSKPMNTLHTLASTSWIALFVSTGKFMQFVESQ